MVANEGARSPDEDNATKDTVELPSPADKRNIFRDFTKESEKLKQRVKDVHKHIKCIGGEETKSLDKELKDTPDRIDRLKEALENVIKEEDVEQSSGDVKRRLRILENEFSNLLKVLRRQKQAFQQFDHLRSALKEMRENVFDKLTDQESFNKAFVNSLIQVIELFDRTTKEFGTFLEKTLPDFVYEEEERATTRYLTLTTIATFFSSVTATMLQFSFDKSDGPNRLVNLCWFLSLVFSVSSGVSSLLSMSWRKSVVYYSEDVTPPVPYSFWFNDAPIVLLAISAVTFIVGLNLFAFASHQAHYVTFATVAFTAALSICLLIVTLWFLIKLYWFDLFFQRARRYYHWVLCHDERMFSVNFAIGDLECWSDEAPRLPIPNGFLNSLRRTERIDPLAPEAAEDNDINVTMKKFILTVRQTFKAPPGSTDKQRENLKRAEDHFQALKNHWDSQTCLAKDIEREGKYLLWGYPLLQQSLYAALKPMHTQEKWRTLLRLEAHEQSTLRKTLSQELDVLLRGQGNQRVRLLEGQTVMQALLRYQEEERNLLGQYQDDHRALLVQQEEDLHALTQYHLDEWFWLVDAQDAEQRKPEDVQKEQQILLQYQAEDERTLREDWKERRAVLQAQWDEMHVMLRENEDKRRASPQDLTLVQALEMERRDLMRCHVEEQDKLIQEQDDERRPLPFYQILARPGTRGNGFRGLVRQNPPVRQQQRPAFQERPESPDPGEQRDRQRATRVAERDQGRATRMAERARRWNERI